MIYVITNNKDFPPNPIYRFAPIEDLLTYLDGIQEVPIDAETRGFCPHTKPLLSLQIGNPELQYVVDCETVDAFILKSRLESKTLLVQNGKFDLKFLYKVGIYPNKICDTFIQEKVINCGLDHIRAGLDSLTDRYCGVTLDKSVRTDIPKEGLSPRVISYAADDIKYLPKIKEEQLKSLQKLELTAVANLENRFVPVLAYIEYCGFKLDEDKWRAKMTKDQQSLQEKLDRLNQWVMDSGQEEFIEQQLDMFKEPGCLLNWSSPKQMVNFFEKQGVECLMKKGGVEKKSVDESVLNKYSHTHDIVKYYLEFKKAEKVTTTYGQNFLEQINPVTGRLHTKFNQIMATGRTSSGGKDHKNKLDFINFQNIPKDPETRGCFVAEPGNTLIISDYVGQEQVILANKSLDPNLLKFYDEGLGDMHAFVASKMYPELAALTLDEIKTLHKDKRQYAKAAGFALSYGGNGSTIAGNLNIPVEEGEKIYNDYFEAFPGLRSHFDLVKQQGLNDGYIMISRLTRRKSFLHFYDRYLELHKKMDKFWWGKYKREKEKDSPEFVGMKSDVKDYFFYKGEIERKSLNFPVQGTAAEIMKIATIYVFDWILERGYFGVVKICNSVHDELVLECPILMAKEVANMVKEFMEKAGAFYCKRVPLKAEPVISEFWCK